MLDIEILELVKEYVYTGKNLFRGIQLLDLLYYENRMYLLKAYMLGFAIVAP